MTNRWLLPENIADVLPFEARKVEELRRRMLDLFQSYGYELVIPPMLEFRESLLTGTGSDLDLQMFKLVDQLSGRTMGVRADMTPQVARIDAHLLNRPGVTRLCYAGTTLQTRVTSGMSLREQLQVGAEVYGHAGWEADLEVMTLMLEVLNQAQLGQVTLDLCHASLVTALTADLKMTDDEQQALYQALAAKDAASLKGIVAEWPKEAALSVLGLLELSGEADAVVAKARQVLPKSAAIEEALTELTRLADSLKTLSSKPKITIDLADLRGYQYHTGVMCSAFVSELPVAVARGGRYDQVGRAFGRSRPATGFSLDLLAVARLSKVDARKTAVLAPWSDDQSLKAAIAKLREAGEVVIQLLPGSNQDAQEFRCDRELVLKEGQWQVVKNVR